MIPELTPPKNELVKGRTPLDGLPADAAGLVLPYQVGYPGHRVSAGPGLRVPESRGYILPRLAPRQGQPRGRDENLCEAMVAARILSDDGPKFLEKMPIEQLRVRKRRH